MCAYTWYSLKMLKPLVLHLTYELVQIFNRIFNINIQHLTELMYLLNNLTCKYGKKNPANMLLVFFNWFSAVENWTEKKILWLSM